MAGISSPATWMPSAASSGTSPRGTPSSSASGFPPFWESHESFTIKDGEELRRGLLSGYQIHTYIIEAVGNSYLTDYYRTILDNIVQIRVYFISRFGMKRLHETVEEHRKILQAIADGDADGAENAMRDHLKRSLVNINQLMLGSGGEI